MVNMFCELQSRTTVNERISISWWGRTDWVGNHGEGEPILQKTGALTGQDCHD
jgi:hypothetical protein